MKFLRIVAGVMILFLLSNHAYAEAVSVVSSLTCHKMRGSNKPFILALKQGENLNQSIVQCANDADLSGASISGLGTIKDPIFHYYDEATKKNVSKAFAGFFELVSLNGNIYFYKGRQDAHIHAAISNHQYQMYGGHLDAATVGALAEITIVPLSGTIIKQKDNATGFDLLVTGS